MNKEQVFEVLELLHNAYPNFSLDQKKIDAWHRLLKDQNPAIIMRNAERYIMEFKFPPSIADLRERKSEPHKSKILELVDKWEREASGRR